MIIFIRRDLLDLSYHTSRSYIEILIFSGVWYESRHTSGVSLTFFAYGQL
jgi:hypothetical protein